MRKGTLVILILLIGLVPIIAFSGKTTQGIDETSQDKDRAPQHQEVTKPKQEEDKNIKPEVQFINPSPEARVSGMVKIEVEVPEAQSCEFYLRRSRSLIPIYLGQGSQTDNTWNLSWKSSNTPNGDYKLYAKITNRYGSYESKTISLEIYNEIEEEAKQKDVKEEIEQTQKEIEKSEEELEQRTKKTSKGIAEQAEELAEETTKEIPQESEEVKKRVEEEASETSKEIEENLDKIAQSNQKETKTEAKLQKKRDRLNKVQGKIQEIKKELDDVTKKKPEQYEETWEQVKKDKQRKLSQYQQKAGEIEKKVSKMEKDLQGERKQQQSLTKKVQQALSNVTEPAMEAVGDNEKAKQAIQQRVQRASGEVKKQLSELKGFYSRTKDQRRKKLEQLLEDSDDDGLNNWEEIKIGTDPSVSDSDGDGYLDSVEKKKGFDPLDPSSADKIIYETPKESKAPVTDTYQVKSVKLGEEEDDEEEKKLIIEGKGLPNSFVTIYVYSEPVVLVTKTNKEGNFVYTLDKQLTEGSHQVYVAVTDNTGEIVERSEMFSFIKTPSGVAALLPPAVSERVVSPAGALEKTYTLLVISIIILSLVVALVVIDILIRRTSKNK